MIAPWVATLIYIKWYSTLDLYVYILFYLLSIPYLLYLAYCFIIYLQKFNELHKYLFFGPEFQRRFIAVLSTSLYATIAILLFRKAYMLHFYFGSELPEILFLVWIVILQISIIFLLTKEHILSLIPTHGGVWNWVRRRVDQYYYLILIFFVAVMVMSNPFVGFDKLVIFVLSRSIYTVFAFGVLYWLNIFLRRGLSHIFFTTEYEVVRERFGYGKSLYGFFVIALFLIFIFIGCVFGAKIWGWPHVLASIGQWSDIIDWLKTPILLKDTAQISFFSMLQVLFFVFMGAIVAFILNRFVLDKIFDILLVESGVQNTVSSLVRYAILIISVILGFQSIDLVAFVWGFIGALALGIGWIIKDPMGDFVAYFIILVQRPLKIGDYIKIDEDITGVVRKITPRSVVLRRKNSTTIILPNSQVITKPVVNWNYLRGFIAFDDIIVTVGYKEDPAFVQKLFLTILAENQYVLKNPQPVVRLDNFSEYGFEFMVRGYISSNYTLDKWDIASAVRLAIAQRLREHNIAIAVPARIIMHKDAGGSVDYRYGAQEPGAVDAGDKKE
jgi:small-conductance mechanosensitive channel